MGLPFHMGCNLHPQDKDGHCFDHMGYVYDCANSRPESSPCEKHGDHADGWGWAPTRANPTLVERCPQPKSEREEA